MTVSDAVANLLAKKAAKDAADQVASAANSAWIQSKTDYDTYVAESNSKRQQMADAIQAAEKARTSAYEKSQQAMADYGQAELDVTASMNQLRQVPV